MNIRIYTDGGARGNPGPAAAGFVIYELNKDGSQGSEIFKDGKYLGEATNNQAEYTAVILALEKAIKLEAQNVEVFMDSELAVKQLNGEYKVKNEGLAKLFVQIHQLRFKFQSISFTHIRREQNKEADAEVNKAIDAALGL